MARPLKALETLSAQARTLIEFYGDAATAAERVGVDQTTLYTARRGDRGFTTLTIHKIEEAYTVVQALRRAGVSSETAARYTIPGAAPAPRREEVHYLEPVVQPGPTPKAPVVAPTPVESRQCPVCDRVLPMDHEHFYRNDRSGHRGFEPICSRCSSRVRTRVQRVLARERGAAEEGAAVVETANLNPGTAAAIRGMLAAAARGFLDLAVELERIDALLREAEGG